jgi:hypothetical protein
MITSQQAIEVFQESIRLWHLDEQAVTNPFPKLSDKYLLFRKNQIDTIQWHKEDEIRRIDLNAHAFIQLKREIDTLNQERTDVVEKLDDLFFTHYEPFPVLQGARLNSETPAWMLDRMSILELKIYHMREQASRQEISADLRNLNKKKLEILEEQRKDLSACFDEVLNSRISGMVYFKVYRQMKMYNDPNLNPSLYKSKKELE